MTRDQRRRNQVGDVRADFSRNNIEEIILLKFKQMSFEFALFSLFFGDSQFIGLFFAFFELPSLRLIRLFFLLPGAKKTGIENYVLICIKRIQRRNTGS